MKFRLKIKLIAFYSLLMFLDLLALTASGVVEAVPILRQSYTIEFDALTGVWFVFRIWGMIELLEMFKGGLESVKKLRAVVVMSDTATTQERLTPTLPRVVHLSLSTKKQDRQTPSSRSHNLQPDYKSVNIFMSNSNAHSSSNNKPNNNVMSVSEPPLTE